MSCKDCEHWAPYRGEKRGVCERDFEFLADATDSCFFDTSRPAPPDKEASIRADERRKCIAEIRAMNKERTGNEWVRDSLWAKIIERAAKTIEREGTDNG